jgi:RNA polymerase sigma-70 factor (ECF subfamily)
MHGNDPFELDACVAAVLRGNREAFRRIVGVFGLTVRGFLAGQVHRMDDVDDLAQEVFLAAFESLDTWRAGEDFAAWLRGIARNKLRMYFRTIARREAALGRFRAGAREILADDLERAAAEITPGMTERLLHCIGELPEKMRRVVRAGLDGERAAQLAEALATSVGAVYVMSHRANQLLRECLRKEEA